ncbi:barstar family protein [Streptomyces sp. NPDC020472]|uniref:barstar family protein n=1 Tax=Streptomyces sp. NPDC020472 TaxID=3365075 RepID=UPI0037A20C29
MQAREHAVWERSFPVGYVLAYEDADGEKQYGARCVSAEGVFADPVPPPREVLTLRGCTPAGPLLEAVASASGPYRPFPEIRVGVRDDRQPLQWWTLVDTTVLAHRPSATDPDLVDITVGTGVREEHSWPQPLPASPRFELFAGGRAASVSAGSCQGIDGLFTARRPAPPLPLRLIGCEPAEPLLAVLRRPRAWERDWAQLWALDRNGRRMTRLEVGLGIQDARPSVLGGTLLDITLSDGGERPSLIARSIWETWYEGIPTTPNQWAAHSAQGREEWLKMTAMGMNGQRPDRSGGEHNLDGRFATDVPGLHLAMAEALLGPGHYFGRAYDAFKDCLSGGFGIVPPFTLVWHDAGIARQALADDVSQEGLTYFEDVVRLLELRGATVVLD